MCACAHVLAARAACAKEREALEYPAPGLHFPVFATKLGWVATWISSVQKAANQYDLPKQVQIRPHFLAVESVDEKARGPGGTWQRGAKKPGKFYDRSYDRYSVIDPMIDIL
eukprot:scaffold923_cov256-Pinguiococcus_pyrenoidosus.AAC.12